MPDRVIETCPGGAEGVPSVHLDFGLDEKGWDTLGGLGLDGIKQFSEREDREGVSTTLIYGQADEGQLAADALKIVDAMKREGTIVTLKQPSPEIEAPPAKSSIPAPVRWGGLALRRLGIA